MENRSLNEAIFQYLKKAVSKLNPNIQSSSEQQLSSLASAFDIKLDSLSSTHDLETIWKNSVPAAPIVSDDDPNYKKYLDLLRERGYFQGAEEGSDEHKDRIVKAKQRYLEKFSKPKQDQQPASTETKKEEAPASTENPEAKTHKDKGNSLFGEKKFKEAIEEYTKSINIDSTNAIYYSNRAAAYNNVQDYQSAISDCEMAIKCNPKYTKTYLRLGTAYTQMGDLQKAKEAYDQGLAVEPFNPILMKEKLAADEKLGITSPLGAPGGMPGMPGMGPGGFQVPPNFMDMFNNPAFIEAATQMMQSNPQIMQMAQQLATQPEFLNNILGGNMPDMTQLMGQGGMPGGMPGGMGPGGFGPGGMGPSGMGGDMGPGGM